MRFTFRHMAACLLATALSAGAAAGVHAQTEDDTPAASDDQANSGTNAYDTAVLTGLNKITARTYTIKAPVGETVTFGALEITTRACRKSPPTEPPKTVAFLEIREQITTETAEAESDEPLFVGWMIASSPGLHALEHPVYDVWVVDCANAS